MEYIRRSIPVRNHPNLEALIIGRIFLTQEYLLMLESNSDDWRNRCRLDLDGIQVSLVVPLREDQYMDEELDYAQQRENYEAQAIELVAACGADAGDADGVDVGLGASWGAIGFVLGFASSVTGIWMTAVHYAPKLKEAIRFLRSKYRSTGSEPTIILSIEALQILVVDTIRREFGLNPKIVTSIRYIEHVPILSERRSEVRQMYSGYTITVEAEKDAFLQVWSFLVTSQGHVVNSSHLKIPCPNETQWSEVSLPDGKLGDPD